jgi:hypothetical protein
MSGSRGRGGKGPRRGPSGGSKPPSVAGKGRAGAGRPEGPPVVGKRPSRPGFLAVLGLLWVAAAIFALFALHTGWKLIPVICFAGVGFLYLRGAAGSYLRRPGPAPTGKK